MTTRKHTPGPWNRGVAQHVYQGARWDPSNQQRFIASCEPTTRTQADWEETWANAALVAAAPELLEALAELVALVEAADNDDWRRVSMVGTDIDLEPYRALVKRARGLA